MPTNEERRQLAERLRGGYDVTWNANGLYWLNGTLFGLDICARSEEKVRDGLLHIAAFIDPEPERACHVVLMDMEGGSASTASTGLNAREAAAGDGRTEGDA